MDGNYQTVAPAVAVGYMEEPLTALKRRGVEVDTLLDIGAAHGHFAAFFETIWPNVKVTALECNERDRCFLEERGWETMYVCLDRECRKDVDFYLNPDEEVGGGSSFYRENTECFFEPLVEKKDTVTLDSMELGAFDFIKIDTQGSEHDIIEGGKKTISQARFLLVEASYGEYNAGGCMVDDIIEMTRPMGFRLINVFGPIHGGHYWNGHKVQSDFLFAKTSEDVFRMV